MDFVTFETAKKLKEKGFDWETSNVYERNIIACRYEDYPKPTISQVLKWLREDQQVDVLIDILIKYDENLNRKRQYTAKILTPKLNKPIYVCSVYIYEKALTHAIDYVLDNLI